MDDLLERLQRGLPDRYTIDERLRRGGMATVFLVTERHPNRRVALKVLDPELTARVGRERFLREVDLLSNLTHPHIVPIFAAGEAEGLLYYTMPFIEGETLRDRIAREIQLPLPTAIRIAHEVADALEYAHSQHVIHRDIKPENILLHSGHTFVADFGIARALEAAEDQHLTESGATLGTPQYMCPEQAAADGEIDGRADIYALGCVLYEMLVGEAPFRGRTAQIILARHAVDPVPPVRTARPTVSVELERTITKALAKTPADRFATAGELSQALVDAAGVAVDWPTPEPTIPSGRTQARKAATRPRAWRLGALGLALIAVVLFGSRIWPSRGVTPVVASEFEDSVAVLVFDNRTGDGRLDHLATGITEEVIKHFSRLSTLKVTSRSSVEALRGAGLTDAQIADTLGVGHLIKGLLAPVQGRLLVSAQIINPETSDPIWGEFFPIDTTDAFLGRERVAEQISRAFIAATDIQGDAGFRHVRHGPGHDAYLEATEWLAQRTHGGITRGIRLLEQAVRLDDTHAPAYAALSTGYALAVAYGYDIGLPPYEAAGVALRLANRAMRLDPDYAGGYSARGFIASRSSAPPGVVTADFERALELEPNAPSGPSWFARVLARQGRAAEALAQAERAVALDPLSPSRRMALANVAFGLRRYELAITAARKTIELQPELMLPRAVEARARLLVDQPERCAALELGPHAGIRAMCLTALGHADSAAAIVDSLTRMLETRRRTDSVFTDASRLEDLATYYAWLGDARSAREWLLRAYEYSPIGVESRVLDSDLFDRVRADSALARELSQLQRRVWSRVRQMGALVAHP